MKKKQCKICGEEREPKSNMVLCLRHYREYTNFYNERTRKKGIKKPCIDLKPLIKESKYLVKKIKMNNYNFSLKDMNKMIELYHQSRGLNTIDSKPFHIQMKMMFNRLEEISQMEKSEFLN
jgi:hypothetical protein